MTALGVDFGTSHTAAVLRRSDGRTRPVLFDGVPQLPSAVLAADAGLLTGRDARYAGRLEPARLEPHPKQRIGDGTVLLGPSEVAVAELIGAVLARVRDEVRLIVPEPVDEVTVTHPADWGAARRAVLRDAATAVFGPVELVPEPVAAAAYLVAVAGHEVPVGGNVLVYDLGAGTFDAAVVRRTGDGFEVVATAGLADAGGLDIDAEIVSHLGETFGARDPERWRRLIRPDNDPDRRAGQQFWDDVRVAKEMLSRTTATRVPVPLFDDDAPLGREQFDTLALPVLARTVAAVRQVLASAGAIRAVFLAGGGSRIPLVSTLLHRETGLVPIAVEQPELVVAEGALHARPPAAPVPASVSEAGPGSGPGPGAGPVSGSGPTTADPGALTLSLHKGRSRRLLVLGAVVAVLLIGGVVAAVRSLTGGSASAGAPTGSGSPTASGPPVGAGSATSTRAGPTAGPTSAPPSKSPKECVVGDWDIVSAASPNVNYYGTLVTVTSTSGARYRYRADGTGETVMTNYAFRGQAAGRRYETVHNGRLTWRYQIAGDRILHGGGGTASGSSVIRVNGSVRERRAMSGGGDSSMVFACEEDRMTIVADTYSLLLKRVRPATG